MRALVLVALGGCDAVFGLSSSPIVPTVDAGDALVAHYPMDDLGSAAVGCMPDTSGAARDGNCFGGMPALVGDGKVGSAYSFDSKVDVRVGDSAAVDPAMFTIAAFVRFHAAPTGTECPFARATGTATADVWQVCVDGTGIVYSVGGAQLSHAQTFTAGQWYHLALTFDGVTAVGYLDGTALEAALASPLPYDANPMSVGADIDRGMHSVGLTGDLDDLWLYGRALTAAEVTSLASK